MSDDTPLQYESLLQQVRECLASPTKERLEQASKLLDEAARLPGGDYGEIQSLRERLAQEKERLDARREYERAKEACQRLWDQEQELIKAKTPPDVILQSIYAEAKKIAEDAYNKYPASFFLEGLKHDADIQYKRAEQRYAIRTTAARTRNYRKKIEELESESDHERQIPWYDDEGNFIGSLRIREALRELTLDARRYAHDKAGEYLRSAQSYLDRSQPRLAHEVLEKRKELYRLPEEDDRELAEFDRIKVQPLLESLSRAESLARQAAATQDLDEGWHILRQAIETFPNAPFIQEVRQDLLKRTLRAIEARLHQARSKYETFCHGNSPNQRDLRESEQALQHAQNLQRQAESAQSALEVYLETAYADIQTLIQERDVLLAKDQDNPRISLLDSRIREQEKEREAFAADLQKNKERLGYLQEEYNQLFQQVQLALLYQHDIEQHFAELVETFEKQSERAQAALSTFLEMYDSGEQRNRYGDVSRRLPRLGPLTRQIQAFEDFSSAMRALEDAFLSADPVRIEQAIREAEALYEQQTDHHERRQKTHEMLRRLRGRLDFLSGQKAWQDGDLAAAHMLLQRVTALPEHPDKADAGERLAEISKQREQEQEIQNSLREAQALLDQRPARAYELLVSLSGRPSHFRNDINAMRERARQRWEENLLDRLDRAVRSSPPLAEELHMIADELLNLPEPRSPRTNQKARQAKAKAFAIDARTHEHAGRLERALEAWDEARRLDPGSQEYVEHWQRIRFDMARRELGTGIGEHHTLGILRDLQNNLGNDPRVSALAAEQYYRLSRLETLDAERRLEHLEQAVQEVKRVRSRSDLSASEQGRLQDLQQTIEREHAILSQQADLEQKLKGHRSLSELNEALDALRKLREEASDRTTRRQLDDWWNRLRSEIVKRLEQTDESLDRGGNDEQRFDIRSRIALLEPEHRLAQAVGPEIVRRAENLLREIDGALNDYKGIQLEIPSAECARLSPPELAYRYQSWLDTLGRRVDTWHGALERFDAEIGADVRRLRANLREKREALSAWQDKFAEFSRNIRVLTHELRWAKQYYNDWGRFDAVLNNINREGFGEHRVTRQILKERDAILSRRKRLEQLCQDVRDALRSPRGDCLLNAQKALERLRAEDPEDEFGLQESLQVDIPFGRTLVLHGIQNIEDWLKQSIEQVRVFGNWLYRSGAPHLWPKEWAEVVEEAPRECVNWEEMRQNVQELQQAGQYKMVYYLLDSVISERPSESSPQHTGEVVKRLTETNRDRLPIKTVLESLSRLPLEEEALLPFLKDLLVDLDNFRRKLQKWLEEAKELRRQTKQREEDWQRAYAELEQTLEELRTIEGITWRLLNPIRYRDELDRAKQRYREALLQCKEIAPYHPLLKDIE